MTLTNLLNVEAVSLSYGMGPVLDDVSLGVGDGERIGVVGRNGAGKSTLLRVLAGIETPDRGRVSIASGQRIAVLAQGDELDPSQMVRAAVVGERPEHDWAGDRLRREIVSTLLRDDVLDRPVATLSGGERRRVALARLLVDAPEILLLDEPTNHLDIETIGWLAKHLAGRRGALVVVTHDRWFLDEVCTQTWEVDAGAVMRYDGGYAAYVLARAERERVASATEARRQNLLRKELAWLRRGPPARTSKPQFRIDAATALIADEPPARDRLQLASFSSARLGKSVFDLERVSLRFADRAMLSSVTWRLGPGDRVGLVGINGSGKTTLLRVLAGLRTLDDGFVRVGQTVRIGYLSQDVVELDPLLRVLEAVESVRRRMTLSDGRELTASALLERFGFASDRQWTPVAELSGGERRRLQLLRLLMDEPNVLLLDEPTNDLDLDTLTALEDLLDGWVGTLVVASHDRYFVERVCDDVVALVGNGVLRGLPGGIDEYLAARSTVAPPLPERSGVVVSPLATVAQSREARKQMIRIERQILKLEQREAALHVDLAAAASDYLHVQLLDAELRDVVAKRSRLEDEWLIASAVVDRG